MLHGPHRTLWFYWIYRSDRCDRTNWIDRPLLHRTHWTFWNHWTNGSCWFDRTNWRPWIYGSLLYRTDGTNGSKWSDGRHRPYRVAILSRRCSGGKCFGNDWK